jgi:hypothetical protein
VLIAKACARLSAEHRAVLFRYFYLTWTTEQIAQDLHIPRGTAESRLYAALRELRRSLHEMGVRRCAPLSAVGESDSPFALQTARIALCDNLHCSRAGWTHRRALVRGVTVKSWRPQPRDAVPADDPPAARLLCDSSAQR